MAYALGFPKTITDLIYELRDWPPRRPERTSFDCPGRDAILRDFEVQILDDWDAYVEWPIGPRRFEKAEWAELIKRNVYPSHSDVDWDEYVEWVSQGGGDGLLIEGVKDCAWCFMSTGRCSHTCMCSMMANYIEAQMKHRTAYISKAMVLPSFRTSLNDRFVALAHEAVKNTDINDDD